MSSESTTVASRSRDGPGEEFLFEDTSEVFVEVQAMLVRTWHLPIIYRSLESGPKGFSELKDAVSSILPKMLSESLSQLEADGIVDRWIVCEQPVRVEYSLTERGRALEQSLSPLFTWDAKYGRSDRDGQ